MSDLVRLQVEIDQEQMNELERLLQVGGLRTKKELLNNALTLLKWAVKEKGRGCAIVSVNEQEGTYKELEMPFLEHVAQHVAMKPQALHTDSKSEEGGVHAAGARGARARGEATPRTS